MSATPCDDPNIAGEAGSLHRAAKELAGFGHVEPVQILSAEGDAGNVRQPAPVSSSPLGVSWRTVDPPPTY